MMVSDGSTPRVHTFLDIPFQVSVEDVLKAMKIRKVSPSLTALVERLAPRANEVARPKALCRVAYIDSRTDATVSVEGHTFSSSVLRQNLEGVQRVFPFVATCGTELEALHVDRGDIMAAYCLDTIMMLAVQTARRHLERWLKATYQITQLSRMAPGSLEDWPLPQQQPLFSLLGDVEARIGVHLSDRYLMIPIKSVSGIFFPTEVRFESCQLCSRPNCPGRRAPYDEVAAVRYGIVAA
jgi:hypothetical protein